MTTADARLAMLIVVFLFTATVATAALGADGSDRRSRPLTSCFVGPAVAAGSIATRSESTPAASSKEQQQQHGRPTTGKDTCSPLARRVLLRRALARPKARAGAESSSPAATRPGSRTAADVGSLFRLEVAQRMKEMKLMTQPGVGPLAPVAGPAAAAASLAETLAKNKLEGDAAALEHQISLLSARIASIADHLKTTPTDAVSRKGLVVLVKRRRRLLETLRHRDNDRWMATTAALGLRQRPDAPATGGEQLMLAARRERRRERGRRRRRRREEGGGSGGGGRRGR
ncbi:expressed unknown protein [Ectocarpus siliculosus]|uniref:30S ribosomal protein S15 n=1 Tax=Ectocarpus siliculosus TaxID=2880 RepID=D7FQW3_ECTSI|nr:expressed unknown protein [Ectocarpus siliculosus]|eukprot:CBJ30673.1 expressed unknown protein [Ectocarpus siliculosus]